MARLPTPVVEKIKISWSEKHKELQKTFFTIIGQAIRKAEMSKKKGGKGKDETD